MFSTSAGKKLAAIEESTVGGWYTLAAGEALIRIVGTSIT